MAQLVTCLNGLIAVRSAGIVAIVLVQLSSLAGNVHGQSDELTFTVAPGLKVQKVADEGLVKWPMLADWDAQGRLVVVESGGVAKPIEKHNEQRLHRIVRLIDEDGDGLMDHRILAADRLPFTEGLLCLGDEILVTAPPNIWKLTDGDGDGYCESREIWFDGQTITGCANDLHGPYLGRDGWIYWCKGAFAEQTHRLINGLTLRDGAAHIHRKRLFGWNPSDEQSQAIDVVMTGGMDNPVELAVLPDGERFFTSTFLVRPGDGQRDGVAHAVYGGVYGKEQAAIESVVRTGSLMPIMTHLGPAAPSGLACLNSTNLIDAESPTLVATLFNMQKILGLTLQNHGATYQTQPVELMVGSRIDFHPTDLLEDVDGSLLVVDTGGWYDLCCPSSRIDQFTAVGGIYRLSREGAAPMDHRSLMPVDWSKVTSQQAAQLLNDPRPWIARMAQIKIANSGDWATDSLQQQLFDRSNSASVRSNALWSLGAIGSEQSLALIVEYLSRPELDPAESKLQQAACHLISLHRHQPAREQLERIVTQAVHQSQFGLARAAVEALGRLGDVRSIALLFQMAEVEVDRFWDHAVRYALFEMRSASEIARYRDSNNPIYRNIALATLGLLGANEYLSADTLIDAANDPATAQVGTALLIQRPQLAEQVLAKLGVQWQSSMHRADPPAIFHSLASGWRELPVWKRFIAQSFDKLEGAAAGKWKDVVLSSRTGQSIPPEWFPWIHESLKSDPLPIGRLLEDANLTSTDQQPLVALLLEQIQQHDSGEVKRQLLVTLPARPLCNDQRLIDEVTGSVKELLSDPGKSAMVWKSLKRLSFTRSVADQIWALAPNYTPTDLLQAIELIASLRDDSLDEAILSQLPALKAAKALPTSTLLNLYRDRHPDLQEKVKQVAEQLLQVDPQVQETVSELLSRLPDGDPIRGLTLFHSTKANCGACHQMGYRGGKIGPELSRIGSARTPEAMLEAILYPSQRIEQGFDTQRVLTVDGQLFNGIVTARSNSSITLRISADKLETILLDQIEEQSPSNVSIMPAGMLELLTAQELADLLSLLQIAK